MGLLFGLLTLPVTGPVKGVAWVAERVLDAAESELAAEDPQREMAELERAWLFGEISEEDFRRREDELWQRLRASRMAQEGPDGD